MLTYKQFKEMSDRGEIIRCSKEEYQAYIKYGNRYFDDKDKKKTYAAIYTETKNFTL